MKKKVTRHSSLLGLQSELKAQECNIVLKKDWPTALCGYEYP